MLNSIRWLDHIGRKSRSKKNEKLENFLTDLQRLTIVHETDHNGSYYRFASKKEEEESGDKAKKDDKKDEAKSADTKKQESNAKKGDDEKKKDDDGGKKGATGGDKGLSDQTGKGHEHAQAQGKGANEVQPDGTQPKPDDQSSEGTHVDPN